MSSSPAESPADPVDLFLIGRTLRGTLGEAFREEAIARFVLRHAAETDARALHSGLSRTVELTAVAVTRAGAVSVDLGIADPAFHSPAQRPGSRPFGAGETVFDVAVEEVEGIRPVPGPPGVDRSRTARVRVLQSESGDTGRAGVPGVPGVRNTRPRPQLTVIVITAD